MPNIIKYSVIIPAYNAEKTIERCLKSFLIQNRNDIQIIVVDDGSKDATAKIVKEIANSNKTVEFIHQNNSGVSGARNNGLKHAKGIYITFVDSDDWVAENYFTELDKMNPDADLCYLQWANSGEKEESLFEEVNKSDTWEKKMQLLLASRVIMNPVNKRFKREIIEQTQLEFVDKLQISEDFNFCLAYSMNSNSIEMYQCKLYHVDLSNENSLSRKIRRTLPEDLNRGFHCAENTIRNSVRSSKEKEQMLIVLDYLYAKNVCTCIAETFKYCKPAYLKNRGMYQKICFEFKDALGNGVTYYNGIHKILRMLLERNLVFPFYMVSWVAKEHKYKRYRGK